MIFCCQKLRSTRYVVFLLTCSNIFNTKRQSYVTIQTCDDGLNSGTSTAWGVPLGSIFALRLFVLDVNDWNLSLCPNLLPQYDEHISSIVANSSTNLSICTSKVHCSHLCFEQYCSMIQKKLSSAYYDN